MILLDTNVVSEPLKPYSNPKVLAWIDEQLLESMYFTATGLAEMLIGVASMPPGKKKDGLGAATAEIVARFFGPRILPFDAQAAEAYALVVSRARARGHTVSVADGQIAAIGHVLGLPIATRDTAPFLAAGLTVINPWEN